MNLSPPSKPRQVLFITLEPIQARMAGPAIRALELAKQLADECEVTVFSPRGNAAELEAAVQAGEPENAEPKKKIALKTGGNKRLLQDLASRAEILVVQGNVLKPYPFLAKLGKYLVVDLYDPYLFMLPIQYQNDEASATSSFRLMHQVLEKHMVNADFAICASERQRDYWIGRFCALGRIDPRLYKLDPSLRKLIDIVPFGLTESAPVKSGDGLRGQAHGINANDPLLIWGGGIWDWFDPLTVIRAVAALRTAIPNIRLVFLGTKSPNPQVAPMPMTASAHALAQSLELVGKHVFFADEWVPYDKRANYLLEADIGVSAHFDLPETRFSFRTRILDYFWCHLPIVTTHGDSLADLIGQEPAGITVPYGDVAAWQQAIQKLLQDEPFRKRCQTGSAKIAERFTWAKAADPLKAFCRHPHFLPRYQAVTMPSLLERAKAVYGRGGKELFLKRSSELIKDFWP